MQSTSSLRTPVARDAIQILTADHKSVRALFQAFKRIRRRSDVATEKSALVRRICMELTVHAALEDLIFYPALRQAIDVREQDAMDEADVEHAGAKDLIAKLKNACPSDGHYDARVTVLSGMIEHHVAEEEGVLFPKARRALDVEELGRRLAARRGELLHELDVDNAPTMGDAWTSSLRRPCPLPVEYPLY